MKSEITKIDKFQDVSHWTTWRFDVKVCLNAMGLLGYVTGTTKKPEPVADGETDANVAAAQMKISEWELKDAKAQRIIVT